jgi:hypothetical protein
MKRTLAVVSLFAVVLVFGAATPAVAAGKKDVQKFERTLSFKPESQKLDLTVGDVTFESVEIKNWPDAEDFAKGEKNPNDTKTMWVVFTYTNKGTGDYKCKFTVSVLDPAGGAPWAVDDAERTQDKGKVGDTNRFGMKMKTHLYKQAKTMKINFEVWKK